MIIRPTMDELESFIAGASRCIHVSSPFITGRGASVLGGSRKSAVPIDIWTRLNVHDWARGASDPLALAQALSTRRGEVRLHSVRRLHAKLYAVDEACCWLGSANLTPSGFGKNIELCVRLNSGSTAAALAALRAACQPTERVVDLAKLVEWVESSSAAVEQASELLSVDVDGVNELLAGPSEALDKILPRRRKVVRPPKGSAVHRPLDLTDEMFLCWLETAEIRSLPGASVVIAHARNLPLNGRVQNRSGHVKRFFYALGLFFEAHPEVLQQTLDTTMGEKWAPAGRDLGMPSGAALESWITFLDEQDDSDRLARFETVRGILPEAVGGDLTAGGGGVGTFRRMFPLVAIFMKRVGKS